ncbi:hypothetical protein [Collinsella sp. TM09-10AT]|uniref:hypothetical protein n=1 Tax=Collinsella sp. TM09-10AT TaxID=2292343 RepID=UPI0013148270|nr:hypothetical protein [Collinsella sp. TM09-10AT]
MPTEYPKKSTVCRNGSSFFARKTVYEKSLPTALTAAIWAIFQFDDVPKKKRFINLEHHTVCTVASVPCFQMECFG